MTFPATCNAVAARHGGRDRPGTKNMIFGSFHHVGIYFASRQVMLEILLSNFSNPIPGIVAYQTIRFSKFGTLRFRIILGPRENTRGNKFVRDRRMLSNHFRNFSERMLLKIFATSSKLEKPEYHENFSRILALVGKADPKSQTHILSPAPIPSS